MRAPQVKSCRGHGCCVNVCVNFFQKTIQWRLSSKYSEKHNYLVNGMAWDKYQEPDTGFLVLFRLTNITGRILILYHPGS